MTFFFVYTVALVSSLAASLSADLPFIIMVNLMLLVLSWICLKEETGNVLAAQENGNAPRWLSPFVFLWLPGIWFVLWPIALLIDRALPVNVILYSVSRLCGVEAGLPSYSNSAVMGIYGLILVILLPVWEGVVLRGALLWKLTTCGAGLAGGGVAVAMLASSLHTGGAVHFVLTFMLIASYFASNSIWPGILFHIAFSALVLALQLDPDSVNGVLKSGAFSKVMGVYFFSLGVLTFFCRSQVETAIRNAAKHRSAMHQPCSEVFDDGVSGL